MIDLHRRIQTAVKQEDRTPQCPSDGAGERRFMAEPGPTLNRRSGLPLTDPRRAEIDPLPPVNVLYIGRSNPLRRAKSIKSTLLFLHITLSRT
jgi:hypothetical protein